MADEAQPQPGTPAANPDAPPSAAQLLAELRGQPGRGPAGAAPAEGEADDAPAKPDVEPEPDDEEPGAEPEPEDDDDPEPEPDDEDPEEPADDLAAKDPELAKRLKVIRQTEQRQRGALDRDRQELERARAAWQTETEQHRKAIGRIEQLASKARYNPIALLEAFGLGADDMEYVAQQAYARSPAAAGKKEYRDAAERAAREREHADELRQTRAELDEVKKDLQKRDQAAAAKADADRYLRRIVGNVDDSTPRVKALIAANPRRARAELGQTALELADKAGGEMPTSKAVRAAHEKKIARQLKDYGIDAAGSKDLKPADAGKKPEAGKKPPAAVKPTGKKPEEPADPRIVTIPSRDDLVRELRASRSN